MTQRDVDAAQEEFVAQGGDPEDDAGFARWLEQQPLAPTGRN